MSAWQPAIGSTVSGTITRVTPYGAFARVADGGRSLHVSELASAAQGDRRPRVGDVVPVKILGVDAERRRLSLSGRLADRR